jgi:hypothetical protein
VAIIHRPAVNLVLCHGTLAPRARWRAQIVSYGHPAPAPNVQEVDTTPQRASALSRALPLGSRIPDEKVRDRSQWSLSGLLHTEITAGVMRRWCQIPTVRSNRRRGESGGILESANALTRDR